MEGAVAEVPARLLEFITPDETAAEFFRRQGQEAVATGLSFIDAHLKLRPGQILELAGPAGSAKSELLIQVTYQQTMSSSGSRRVWVAATNCGVGVAAVLPDDHPHAVQHHQLSE
jgi:RecA/RadA recombinase